MDENELKNCIKVFQFASEEAFRNMESGINKIVELGGERNVMHFKNIANDNEIGKATLLAAQSIPAIVNLCLCIEMALKLLILQSLNIQKKGHDLEKLFYELSGVIQEKIRDNVVDDMNISNDKFYDLLGKNKSGFIEWRYFYETSGNSSGIGFLKTFLEDIKKEINW